MSLSGPPLADYCRDTRQNADGNDLGLGTFWLYRAVGTHLFPRGCIGRPKEEPQQFTFPVPPAILIRL